MLKLKIIAKLFHPWWGIFHLHYLSLVIFLTCLKNNHWIFVWSIIWSLSLYIIKENFILENLKKKLYYKLHIWPFPLSTFICIIVYGHWSSYILIFIQLKQIQEERLQILWIVPTVQQVTDLLEWQELLKEMKRKSLDKLCLYVVVFRKKMKPNVL